ncbi:hypothetical protein BX666DRAFT_2060544 [Dichotomocladium elegans]|nr:hypothetical protein BX666DRAFT_2060544 [Dichotomocladium elegans]
MLHSTRPPTVPLDRPPKSISADHLRISIEELESLEQGSGAIPLGQFKQIIGKLNIATDPIDIDLIARAVDVNNDRVIDFEEFAAAMVRHWLHDDDVISPPALEDYSSRPYQDEDAVDLLECFQEFDKNRDGLISQAELEEVMINLGERLSPQDIKAMMIEADTNKDGFIDFEEFKNLMP